MSTYRYQVSVSVENSPGLMLTCSSRRHAESLIDQWRKAVENPNSNGPFIEFETTMGCRNCFLLSKIVYMTVVDNDAMREMYLAHQKEVKEIEREVTLHDPDKSSED